MEFLTPPFRRLNVYVRLREFYYRELLKTKEEETSQMERVSKSNSSSKTKRK